jgi:DNA excision repair protein ERCC-2
VYLEYFPYESLRPYQDKMLDAVYETIRNAEHGVLMIDAPTGCGKTSCISAALAAAPGKVVVAVRTVSQIGIYLDEVQRIWSQTRHKPEISYMVGKQKICPIEDEFRGESVYAGCSRLKEWTKNYMSSRLNKSQDSIYDPTHENIPQEEAGYRTFCPYYLRSREAFELNGRAHFRRSGISMDVVEALKKRVTPPEDLAKMCKGICPYEIMSLYAKNSDIVIMNYSHLFSPDFQDIIFQWLDMEPEKVTVIVDEAHNLGDAVRSMSSRTLTMRMLDMSEREVEKFESTLSQARLEESRLESSWRREGIKVIRTILPRLRKFMQSRQARMSEGEVLLDADMLRTFLYDGIEKIDEALSYFSDVAVAVAELNLAEGDKENLQGDIQPNLALVLLFLRDVEQAEVDQSYQRKIVVNGNSDKKWVRLEVNKIDPAPVIRRITDYVNATIMLSGTLSPLKAYELYCLGEEGRAKKVGLPNPFPRENRLLLAAEKASTQLEVREDADNRREIVGHIESIIEGVPGNVAIFFTSYPMMNNYRETCLASSRRAGKKLCIEPRSSEDVPDLLDEFFKLGHKGGGVLLGVCGGKLAEGIDYKGEALNGVAVVGLPLGVYDEIQKEINVYYIKKYGKTNGMLIAYTLPAINRGLQAAGRVIRSESERGVLLFCDRRFSENGIGSAKQFLPEWVQKELIIVDARKSRELIKSKVTEWGKTVLPEVQCLESRSENPAKNRRSAKAKSDNSANNKSKRSESRDFKAADLDAINPLIASIRARDKTERKRAAENLEKVGRPAIDPLISALDDRISYVRAMAAKVLGNIGDPRAAKPLRKALQDKDSSVRKEVAAALTKLEDQ